MGNRVITIFDSTGREKLVGNTINLIRHEGMVRRYYPFHQHNYYEISLTFRGEHSLQVGRESIAYGSGDICIITPGTLHSFRPVYTENSRPEEDLVWTLKLAPELITIKFLQEHEGMVVPMGESADVLDANLKLLLDALQQPEIRLPLVQSVTTLIIELIRLRILENENVRIAADRSDAYLREILKYIADHYHEDITVDGLAHRFALSRSSLMRLFQDNLEITPINYRIDWQIMDACDLLLKTDRSVQEIAEELGFHNVYYFSSLFSKRMQVSPNRFRHQFDYEVYH